MTHYKARDPKVDLYIFRLTAVILTYGYLRALEIMITTYL